MIVDPYMKYYLTIRMQTDTNITNSISHNYAFYYFFQTYFSRVYSPEEQLYPDEVDITHSIALSVAVSIYNILTIRCWNSRFSKGNLFTLKHTFYKPSNPIKCQEKKHVLFIFFRIFLRLYHHCCQMQYT